MMFLNPYLDHIPRETNATYYSNPTSTKNPIEKPESDNREVSPPSKKKETFIYFIRNTSNGLVKIGQSVSIERRLRTLQTAVGDCKLNIENKIRMSSGSRAKTLEKNIHKIFEKQRQQGEWFDVSSKSIEVFIRVLRTASTQSMMANEKSPKSPKTIQSAPTKQDFSKFF